MNDPFVGEKVLWGSNQPNQKQFNAGLLYNFSIMTLNMTRYAYTLIGVQVFLGSNQPSLYQFNTFQFI